MSIVPYSNLWIVGFIGVYDDTFPMRTVPPAFFIKKTKTMECWSDDAEYLIPPYRLVPAGVDGGRTITNPELENLSRGRGLVQCTSLFCALPEHVLVIYRDATADKRIQYIPRELYDRQVDRYVARSREEADIHIDLGHYAKAASIAEDGFLVDDTAIDLLEIKARAHDLAAVRAGLETAVGRMLTQAAVAMRRLAEDFAKDTT